MLPGKVAGVVGGVIFVLVILSSIHAGYTAGIQAENESELNASIEEVETNYSETKSENLSKNYSEYAEQDTPTGYRFEPVDRFLFDYAVKPAYWFGRTLLDVSATVFEGTARFAYSNL